MNVRLDDYGDVLTVEDVMKILRIGRNTAYSLIKSEELKSIRIGYQLRIPKAYLVEYLNQKIRIVDKEMAL